MCTKYHRDTRPHNLLSSIEYMLASTGDGVHRALCMLSLAPTEAAARTANLLTDAGVHTLHCSDGGERKKG